MTVTEICPNPDCRARLVVTLPAPGRIHCPRCHRAIVLQPSNPHGGLSQLNDGLNSSPDEFMATKKKSQPIPSWLLATYLLLVFVSGACALLMVINYWHLSQLNERKNSIAKSIPFQMNLRFRPPEAGFISKPTRIGRKGASWEQDWVNPTNSTRLLIGIEDQPEQVPDIEDFEPMTLSRLQAVFPEPRFQLALKKQEDPILIGSEPCTTNWALEVVDTGDNSDGKGDPVRLFGSVSVLARRGYIYWFAGLAAKLPENESKAWWSGLELGDERADWKPQPMRELSVVAFGSKLTLDPDIWRVLQAEEKNAFTKPLSGEVKPGLTKSPFEIEMVFQGRKKRSTSLEGGLKTNSTLMAIAANPPANQLDLLQKNWEHWRLLQSPESGDSPVVKLVPLADYPDFFRSTINGETEELVLLVPLPNGAKGAWVASCPYEDRSEWIGNLSKIRRYLLK